MGMAFGKDPLKGVALLLGTAHFVFSEHGKAPRWTLRMHWRHGEKKMRGSHGIALFIRVFFLSAASKPRRLGNKVASGTPSSSSLRPLFMYVKVPDPMPKTWLVKYSILTYFVPPVALFIRISKTMMGS